MYKKQFFFFIIIFSLLLTSCAKIPPPIPVTYKPVYEGEVTEITEPIEITHRPHSGASTVYLLTVAQDELLEESKTILTYNIMDGGDSLLWRLNLQSIEFEFGKLEGSPLITYSFTTTKKGIVTSSEVFSNHPVYNDEEILKDLVDYYKIGTTAFYQPETKIKTGDYLHCINTQQEQMISTLKELEIELSSEQVKRIAPKVQGLVLHNGKEAILSSTEEVFSFVHNGMIVLLSVNGYTVDSRATMESLQLEYLASVKIIKGGVKHTVYSYSMNTAQ